MTPELPRYWFKLTPNTAALRTAYGDEQESLFDAHSFQAVRRTITTWPGYRATPLRSLPGLAQAAAVASIHYKDEGNRFGMGSFKPLGGAYAVARLLVERIRKARHLPELDTDELFSGNHQDILSSTTVTAATDGNHGRSVAWGAKMFGCRCVIFIHETVTPGRERAIAALGAEVRRTPGTYDDAVRTAQQTANREGWYVIPDTSHGESTEAPLNVMRGYTLMAAEAIEQLPYREPPTHLFLQAGVGGMAAAVVAHFWRIHGSQRPLSILVEPHSAACWYLSLKMGRPTPATGPLDSIMAGLSCGEISHLAWKVLLPGADAALQIDDDAAADSMRLLANDRYGDGPLVAGESGVAGLAGLLATAGNAAARQELCMDEHSRILVFGTEGASDPDTYHGIVGSRPEEICRG